MNIQYISLSLLLGISSHSPNISYLHNIIFFILLVYSLRYPWDAWKLKLPCIPSFYSQIKPWDAWKIKLPHWSRVYCKLKPWDTWKFLLEEQYKIHLIPAMIAPLGPSPVMGPIRCCSYSYCYCYN